MSRRRDILNQTRVSCSSHIACLNDYAEHGQRPRPVWHIMWHRHARCQNSNNDYVLMHMATQIVINGYLLNLHIVSNDYVLPNLRQKELV